MDKRLVFLTNNFSLPSPTVAALYRCRWQVELFFKWIKQHLRVKVSARNRAFAPPLTTAGVQVTFSTGGRDRRDSIGSCTGGGHVANCKK